MTGFVMFRGRGLNHRPSLNVECLVLVHFMPTVQRLCGVCEKNPVFVASQSPGTDLQGKSHTVPVSTVARARPKAPKSFMTRC